jgi:4-hydroxy-tetrahydrodipicolinate synthase
MCKALKGKNMEEARRIHFKLEPLNKAMFIETNPVPAKTALSMMGKIQEEMRLPLCPMSDANREELKNILINQKLLSV